MTGVHYRLVSGVVSSACLDAVLRIEYFVYLLTLLLLRPAIYASLCEFLLRSRALLPRKQSAMLVTAPFTYKMLTAPVSSNDKNQRRCSRQDGSRSSPVRAIRATRQSYCSMLLVSTEPLESTAICVLLVGRSTREHYKFVFLEHHKRLASDRELDGHDYFCHNEAANCINRSELVGRHAL